MQQANIINMITNKYEPKQKHRLETVSKNYWGFIPGLLYWVESHLNLPFTRHFYHYFYPALLFFLNGNFLNISMLIEQPTITARNLLFRHMYCSDILGEHINRLTFWRVGMWWLAGSFPWPFRVHDGGSLFLLDLIVAMSFSLLF